VKIAIQTWGSTGDTNPFISLAAALAKGGHDVSLALATTDRKDFTAIGKKYGFNIAAVDRLGETITELNNIGRRAFAIRDPLQQLSSICQELFNPYAERMYATAQELCAKHDLVIGHFIHHVVHLAAEQAGKPYLTVSLNHGLIKSKFSAPHPIPNLGRWINPWSWRLLDALVDRTMLPIINDFRTSHGAAEAASTRSVWESPLGNLVAVSPLLCRPQPDWGSNQKICGFLNLPPVAGTESLPKETLDFLAAGDPPVYFTYGSMMGLPEPSDELEESIRIWEKAVALAGCRAIMQTHWGMAQYCPQDGNIHCIEYADHALLFPHCAAVVHHGGAGTTQSALLAGCPSVIVSHIVDQHLFGAELLRLGVAAKPIRQETANPEKIAKAIRQVMRKEIKQNAIAAGNILRQEKGAETARRHIEQIMG